MITRNGKSNFFAAHYDWLAAGVGILALLGAVAYYFSATGEDPDAAAADETRRLGRMQPRATAVRAVDLDAFQATTRLARNPVVVAEISEKSGSFLASDRRLLCKNAACGKAVPGGLKVCPFCQAVIEVEKAVVLDADGDGLPDEWEKRNGLNPNQATDAAEDSDKDGFTNLEEFAAKTDPRDRNDHPDYLDSLKIQLPLKETHMPFVFRKANKIPGGWRCEFLDPARKNDYGRMGRTVTAKVGEKIVDADGKNKVDYGFTVKSYTEKSTKRERKGMKGMFVTVDVSEVVVVRERDGKAITLVIQEGKAAKPVAVDVQATLVYTRGETKNFDVVPGQEIDLNGTKYRVSAVRAAGKGAEVEIENALSGKKRVLTALEQ